MDAAEDTALLLAFFLGTGTDHKGRKLNQIVSKPDRWLEETHDGNQLASLPESFANLMNLISLDLSDNQLTSLPESLGNLTSLKFLRLSGNQLASLPESFGNLISLQSLDLSDNQLTNLPIGIRQLPALTEVFLHDNPGLGLPVEVLGPTRRPILVGSVKSAANEFELLPQLAANPASIFDYYFQNRAKI